MGMERNRRTNRTAAERLLSGDPTACGDLADLLAAAASPVPDGILAGEDAAMAAFRAARHEPARRRLSLGPSTARLLTAKIAALVVVVLGAGGVAVAATTGVLPNPLRTHPTGPGPALATQRSTPTPAPSPTAPGSSGSSPTAGPSPAASANLHGLCTAYAAQLAAGHSHVLDNPAFGRLIAAAGGTSQVAAYCSALTAPSAGTTAPGHRGIGSTNHPTGKPGATRGGGSDTHATGPRSSHPGGAPTHTSR